MPYTARMSTTKKFALLIVLFLILTIAFTANGLYVYEAKQNILLRSQVLDVRGKLSATEQGARELAVQNISEQGANTAHKGITKYSFECGTSTDLYREYSDGSKELVAAHIENSPANAHPGDCYDIESSNEGTWYDQAKKLYLVQSGDGDAGGDGYFEFDLAKKTLSRSPLLFANMVRSYRSAFGEYELWPGKLEADGEIRSLDFNNFITDTTGTVAILPKSYSYMMAKRSNELNDIVDYRIEVSWESGAAIASVFSAKDKIVDCDSMLNPGPCKMRVPVFKVGLDLGSPQDQQVVKP